MHNRADDMCKKVYVLSAAYGCASVQMRLKLKMKVKLNLKLMQKVGSNNTVCSEALKQVV